MNGFAIINKYQEQAFMIMNFTPYNALTTNER